TSGTPPALPKRRKEKRMPLASTKLVGAVWWLCWVIEIPSGGGRPPLNRNRIWRDCCLSPLCHSRASGNPAPQDPLLAPWIPACAGMTTTERLEYPNAIALPSTGRGATLRAPGQNQ